MLNVGSWELTKKKKKARLFYLETVLFDSRLSVTTL